MRALFFGVCTIIFFCFIVLLGITRENNEGWEKLESPVIAGDIKITDINPGIYGCPDCLIGKNKDNETVYLTGDFDTDESLEYPSRWDFWWICGSP
jgi:hypothetical protein